jgi:hypothetical protein
MQVGGWRGGRFVNLGGLDLGLNGTVRVRWAEATSNFGAFTGGGGLFSLSSMLDDDGTRREKQRKQSCGSLQVLPRRGDDSALCSDTMARNGRRLFSRYTKLMF